MKKILFVSNITYPYGGAYSSRFRHLVQLFRYAGYDVDMMVAYDNSQPIVQNESISYVREKTGFIYRNSSLCAIPYEMALRKYLKSNQVSLIISSSMPFMAPSLYRIAKKHKIPYVIEQCEWFDKTSFRFQDLDPKYRKHVSAIRKFNFNLDGVIAISTLFERYYISNHVPTVRIPAIIDTQKSTLLYPVESQYLRVAFAGSLGNGKEHLTNIIDTICLINQNQTHIVMDIYGPDKNDVLQNIGKDQIWLDQVEHYIKIHGRISQSEVSNYIGQADFSFIMRPLRRSSNAGFPTKLAESMEIGTPVIANNTGDIGMYIESGHNGFIVEDTVDKLYALFQELIHFSRDDLVALRKAARATAEKSFDYRNYKDDIKQFVDYIIEKEDGGE